jgi:hypothetical protein
MKENLEYLCINGEMVGCYKHNSDNSSYGNLFNTEDGLIFKKWKWVEVNKNKSTPKVCMETHFTFKKVDEKFYNHFIEIPEQEFNIIWMEDSK